MGFEPTTLRVLERMPYLWATEVSLAGKSFFVGWTCEPHLAVTQSITSKDKGKKEKKKEESYKEKNKK